MSTTWLALAFAALMIGAGVWIGARLSRPDDHEETR